MDDLLHRGPGDDRSAWPHAPLVVRQHPAVIAWVFLLVLTLGIGTVGYTENQDREEEIDALIQQGEMQQEVFTRGNVEERDINCRLLEEIDQRDVEDLALLRAAAEEGTGSPATLNQIKTAERRARRIQAPTYCDRPGLGLPEMRR